MWNMIKLNMLSLQWSKRTQFLSHHLMHDFHHLFARKTKSCCPSGSIAGMWWGSHCFACRGSHPGIMISKLDFWLLKDRLELPPAEEDGYLPTVPEHLFTLEDNFTTSQWTSIYPNVHMLQELARRIRHNSTLPQPNPEDKVMRCQFWKWYSESELVMAFLRMMIVNLILHHVPCSWTT